MTKPKQRMGTSATQNERGPFTFLARNGSKSLLLKGDKKLVVDFATYIRRSQLFERLMWVLVLLLFNGSPEQVGAILI
ncbi:hypothetical protein ACUXV3_08200 [Roseobacteraceae bacterium NS-SX3]